ncbi:MFS transporter [Micrococcus antarcticus]|uniref:MFS transporter n=1 Tax=Micrococcus antarcticus TaxID=86171 RepID=UPI00384FA811
MTPAGLLDTTPRRAAQRRTVRTLAASQVFSGLGNGSALAVGSVMAVELSGHAGWGGTTTMAMSLAGALSALPLARLALAHGRRTALTAAYGLAALGTVGMVLAPVLGSYPLLLAAALLVGLGAAGNLQARFAATDLADDATRARDLGLVVWSITLGAVAGPNLIGPGAALARPLGLPDTSGPFLLSLAGMLLAVAVLQVGLRPDPLTTALRLGGGPPAPRPRLADGLAVLRRERAVALAVTAVVTAHAVMVAVMSMTPVHLARLAQDAAAQDAASGAAHAAHDHAAHLDTFVVIGLVISLHVAGMYALSPVMGHLADRWGRVRLTAVGLGTLAAACLLAGAGRASVPVVTVGLILLGLGWSAATVAGSARVSELVTGTDRVLVQGVTDAGMGLAGAAGAGLAGVVLGVAGYGGLAVLSAMLALVVAAAALRGASPGPTRVRNADIR